MTKRPFQVSFVGVATALSMLVAGCGGAAAPASSPSAAAPASSPAAKPAASSPAASASSKPAASSAASSASAKPAASSAASGSAAAGASAGKVTIALGTEPTTLDPQARDDGNTYLVIDNIYETLVQRDQAMKLTPSLATKWELKNPTTWEFTLRSGIKFTDGEPFNADAAAFSVKRIIDPKFNSEQLSFFSTLKDAKAVNDTTVDVITDGPDPILPARMYWLRMVPPKAAAGADFGNKPVGTGPYKFVSWTKGQQIVLTANDQYWGGAPKIKDVVWRPIPEEATSLAGLKSGEIDLTTNLTPEEFPQAPKAEQTASVEFPIIRLNTKSGPLTDPKVRQAMNYAINKDGIKKAIFNDDISVSQGQIINDSMFGFNPNIKPYPYDVNKAKQLLAQAGKPNLAFNLVTESGRFLKDKELTQAVAGQLQQAGMKPTVKVLEFKSWLDTFFNLKQQPDSIFVSSSNELFDADRNYSGYLTCDGRASSYCNQPVTDLINKARNETDTTKREQMYQQAGKMAYDDAAVLYLFNYNNTYGLSKRLQWKPRVDGAIFVKDMTLS